MFGFLMQSLLPVLLGVWTGWMIGQLSHHALGQYDLPLPLEGAPTLLFVSRNVDEFVSAWELPLDELRYALVLREAVHGAQRSVPWVREHLACLAEEYVGAYEMRPTRSSSSAASTSRTPKRCSRWAVSPTPARAARRDAVRAAGAAARGAPTFRQRARGLRRRRRRDDRRTDGQRARAHRRSVAPPPTRARRRRLVRRSAARTRARAPPLRRRRRVLPRRHRARRTRRSEPTLGRRDGADAQPSSKRPASGSPASTWRTEVLGDSRKNLEAGQQGGGR